MWERAPPAKGRRCRPAGFQRQRGKAQNFFEAAANSSQSATALAELSRLYLALGDQVKAAKVLERRVAELDGQLPDLPLP